MTNSALQSDQICHIASVILTPSNVHPPIHDVHDSGEQVDHLPVLDDSFAAHLDDLLSQPSLLMCAPGTSIQQLISDPALLTHCVLKGHSDWPEWNAAEHAQLNTHHAHHTFGKLMIRPKIYTALRPVWNYVMKWNGEKKARICCDGHLLSLRGMQLVHAIYNACVLQTGMKLFFALSALLAYYIYNLDAINAHAQGGRPYDDCYLIVDDPFCECYKLPFQIDIPPGYIVPILTPLQGHPNAGEVWQHKVNTVLLSFSLKPTLHESTVDHFKAMISSSVNRLMICSLQVLTVVNYNPLLKKLANIFVLKLATVHLCTAMALIFSRHMKG
jgi:hypothetical protein